MHRTNSHSNSQRPNIVCCETSTTELLLISTFQRGKSFSPLWAATLVWLVPCDSFKLALQNEVLVEKVGAGPPVPHPPGTSPHHMAAHGYLAPSRPPAMGYISRVSAVPRPARRLLSSVQSTFYCRVITVVLLRRLLLCEGSHDHWYISTLHCCHVRRTPAQPLLSRQLLWRIQSCPFTQGLLYRFSFLICFDN